MRILFIPRLSDEVITLASSFLPEGFDLEVIDRDAGEEGLISAVARADIIMGYIRSPFSRSVLEAMKNVQLIQLLSAGYDKVDIEAMARLRIPVANNGGANSVAVAEHTMMLILALYRDLAELDARVKSGGWLAGPLGSQQFHELAGKTVGLVGLGMIGREVAKHLRPFETGTKYFDKIRPERNVEEDLEVEYVDLHELLETSDVVSLHCPLNPETRHMIGQRELNAMKRTSLLINTARGGLVDHSDLYWALRNGVIAGAGLDVVEPMPPPADMPLLSLPNVILTPHTAGITVESWPKRLRNAYANIQRVADGSDPLWVVPELRGVLRD
jgi:phosphoglycerate dehydrogenase-like enzyme